jgi:hypothetical protein
MSTKKRPGRKCTSGYRGVHIRQATRKGERYVAVLPRAGKLRYLGTFGQIEMAAAAVAEADGDGAEAMRLRVLAARKREQASIDAEIEAEMAAEQIAEIERQAAHPLAGLSPAEIARRAGYRVTSNDAEIAPPARPRRRAGEIVKARD